MGLAFSHETMFEETIPPSIICILLLALEEERVTLMFVTPVTSATRTRLSKSIRVTALLQCMTTKKSAPASVLYFQIEHSETYMSWQCCLGSKLPSLGLFDLLRRLPSAKSVRYFTTATEIRREARSKHKLAGIESRACVKFRAVKQIPGSR